MDCDNQEECKKGAPLWMTTFADLMSLLMALFVLLFAMSSMEASKFDEVANSFKVLSGTTIVEFKKDSDKSIIELKPLYESLIESFSRDLKNHHVSITMKDQDIYIVFPGKVAFESGSAEFKPEFKFILRKLFPIKYYDNAIRISGHTDSNSIQKGGHFRSNWELSGSRAASIGEYLIDKKLINKRKLKIEGLADTKRVSINDSPKELAKDRRVEIIIIGNKKK